MGAPPSTTRRLLGYFRPYRGKLIGALLLIAAQSAIPGALVFLIEGILDDVLIAQDQRRLALLPAALVCLYALNGVLGFGRGMLTRDIAWRVVTVLREALFRSYLRQDVAWHQKQSTGDLLARLSNDVSNVQYGVSGIVTAIQKPLTLIILVGSAFAMNPRLAVAAVILLPLIAIPIDRFGRRLRQTAHETMDSLAHLTASSAETLSGIRVVQAFRAEEERLAVFQVDNEEQRRLKMASFVAELLPSPIVELIASLGVGLALWIGGGQVMRGEIQPGELIAFLFALGLLNDPLKGLALIQSLVQRALAGAEAVFALLDRAPVVPDTGREPLPAGPLCLRFEGVSFDYGDGPVLQDLSLELPPGRMVALVGASGSGKSTAASLIPRFYDPTGGRLTLNGVDLRDLPLATLRDSLAVVSQEGFLFNDTVRANIVLGRVVDDAAVEAAARAAGAHAFIQTLPRGYLTRIDEGGLRLSGGQRQRICIARAMLRDAPLLILDEATSALDAESERQVQDALERLMVSRSVLAIAHRLSTIRDADEIIVLEHGRVVERGRHAELIDAEGVYARLVQQQTLR